MRFRIGTAMACRRELEIAMPITPYLKNQAFDPELVRAMAIAFESACRQLGLARSRDRHDHASEAVATKIIRLAQQGENDPDTLCRRVVREFNADA